MIMSDLLIKLKDKSDIGYTCIETIDEMIFHSYKDLHIMALNLLNELKSSGVKPGNELIVLVDSKAAYYVVFWACVYGGIRSVLANADERYVPNFIDFSNHCECPYFITDHPELYSSNFDDVAESRKLTLIGLDQIFKNQADESLIYPGQEYDVVTILFSSGSTSVPKGIALTNKNIVSFLETFSKALGMQKDEIILAGLPAGAVTDLAFSHLIPIYCGYQQYHIKNRLFAKNPTILFDLLTMTRATITFAVSSLLELFSSYANHNPDGRWDFSAIRHFIVGAEPVTVKSSQDFCTSLQHFHLKSGRLKTAYGLTETMSAITISREDVNATKLTIDARYNKIGSPVLLVDENLSDDTHSFVPVGIPLEGQEIAIADENGQFLAEDYVGIVYAKGSNVSDTYYGGSSLKNDEGWFNTGDIGILHQGQLYIIGRYKDMFIVNGKNFYYSDLDYQISNQMQISSNALAFVAFSNYDINRKANELVCFLLWPKAIDSEFHSLANMIGAFCFDKFGLTIVDFIALPEFPKTKTGKLKRHFMFEQYVKQVEAYCNIYSYYSINSSNSMSLDRITYTIKDMFSQVLLDDIDVTDSYIDFIGDSMNISKIHLLVDKVYPHVVSLAQMFQFTTIQEMSEYINDYFKQGIGNKR